MAADDARNCPRLVQKPALQRNPLGCGELVAARFSLMTRTGSTSKPRVRRANVVQAAGEQTSADKQHDAERRLEQQERGSQGRTGVATGISSACAERMSKLVSLAPARWALPPVMNRGAHRRDQCDHERA